MSKVINPLYFPSLVSDNGEIPVFSTKCEIDSNAVLYDIVIDFLGKSTKINLMDFTYNSYEYTTKKDDEFGIKFKSSMPYNKNIYIEFKDKKYAVNRKKIGDVVGTKGRAKFYELLTIHSENHEALNDLIHWAIMYAERDIEQKANRTNIDLYIYENGYWNHMTTQSKRSIDTIYLDESTKDQVVFDVEHFIKNKEMYEKFGIQYKRSYLFTGPPGTGKSSLISALASLYDYNVGIFKVSAEKRSLESAIKSIPKNTFLVIEDIEHVFPTKDLNREHKGINESDILNSLNGIFYKSGLLIFLTANDTTRISKKILRPGRVDYRLKFDFCTKDQIKTIYNTFIKNGDADAFYEKVKMIQLTPAVLQTVLFNRHNEDIIQNLSGGLAGKKRKRDIIDELRDLVDETKEDTSHTNLYQ